MTDQKKTLPFHITITHGDEILTDTDTDGILAAVSTTKDECGGTEVHLLTECNTIKLLGLLEGAKRAEKQAIGSISKGLAGVLFGTSENESKDE